MKSPDYSFLTNLRKKLFTIVFGTDTHAGKSFDIILLWSIVLSVVVVMLESINELRPEYGKIFIVLEWGFTIIFTIEYALRIFIAKKPIKFVFSFFGLIDLLALIPTYLTLIVVGSNYLVVIRIIRLLRIFRILKLTRFVKEAAELKRAMQAAQPKILIFLGVVITIVIIMGTLMYLIEGGSNEAFTSIPRSVYWAIVTVTTVGYGDLTPQTIIGQILASMLMLIGYAIIAVPTGIVTSEMKNVKKETQHLEKKDTNNCLSCKTLNDDDAIFCKQCGKKLVA